MKRGAINYKYLVLGLLLLTSVTSYGIGVDVEELKTSRKVDFINYPGPTNDLLSAEDVRGLGRNLSRELSQQGKTSAQYENKYTVIHAFNPAEKEKRGADILIISPNVIILHIDFIRHLLTGFLMNHYSYSLEDAKVIAIFITYYNAVHRGELPYFTEHYQAEVCKNITSSNAGIALNYEQWPGNTRLLIPLTEASGKQNLGKIDTALISDDKVINELQKKEDKGITERTNLTEIKEKKLTEDKTALQEDKTNQLKAKEELKKSETELEKEKKELVKEEEQLAKDKKDLNKITNPDEKKTKENEIAKKEEELKAKKEEVAKKEDAVKNKQDEIVKKDTAIANEDKKIIKKEEEINKDKATIEKDKKVIEVKKDPEKFVNEMEDLKNKTVKTEPILKNTLFYLKVKEYLTDGHYDNELFAIDVMTNQLVKAANNTKICGHEYFVIPEGILVITHANSHRGHYLTLLDTATLEPKIIGQDMIFHRSFVQFRGDFIYAIIWDGQKSYYLGKFDKKLQRVAQSVEKIDDNSVFHLFGEQIYLNTPGKKIVVLSDKDLSTQKILDF